MKNNSIKNSIKEKKTNKVNKETKVKKTNDKQEKINIKQFLIEKKLLFIIVFIILILIIVGILVYSKLREKTDNKFALNPIFDLQPEEIKELYSNMVSVSCSGDLYLDVKLDAEKTNVDDMNKKNLLDYMFSYLDKNNKLNDELTVDDIKDAESNLFYANLKLEKAINNYNYGEYTYNVNGKKIVRTKSECSSDIKYVSFLFGYSNNDEVLSVDVNMSYTKDGKVYSLAGKELGKYVDDLNKLNELMSSSSFYRMNYVKQNDMFKLSSVELINRG